MYHEGPPAVAVTDTGNAQNTSIIKSWHAHSLSCALHTYCEINMVRFFTLCDFFWDVFLLVKGVKLIITVKSSKTHPAKPFINRTRAYQKLSRSPYSYPVISSDASPLTQGLLDRSAKNISNILLQYVTPEINKWESTLSGAHLASNFKSINTPLPLMLPLISSSHTAEKQTT